MCTDPARLRISAPATQDGQGPRAALVPLELTPPAPPIALLALIVTMEIAEMEPLELGSVIAALDIRELIAMLASQSIMTMRGLVLPVIKPVKPASTTPRTAFRKAPLI